MKYLVVPDDDGQYVNNDGEHFNVIYGGFVVGPRAKEFKKFDTLQHALEYYRLIDPNAPISEPEEQEQQQEPQEEVVISNEENTTEEQSTVSETENVEESTEEEENEQGKKFNLITCSWVKGQRANEFVDFDSLEDALENFGLTEVEDGNGHN